MTDASEGTETPQGDDPLVGSVLDGRYRIVGRLGAGGMGIVYEAKHEVLNTRLAIKVLRREAATNEEALERSRREAQAASAIGSDHIVDVRDFGRLEDGSTFVVMELIEGKDLFSIVHGGPLEWRRACRIAAQVCDALSAAHGQGIVHRDLKLENVLLTARGDEPDFVKIVDFGIAKVQGGAKITAIGRVMGTPEYMSPEQCAGRGVDHRTDIYSLGVMLFEMVTGTLPFEDPDLLAVVRKQMREPPPSPRALRPEIPAELEAIILRCLAKEKGARFQAMDELARALRALPGVAIERAAPPSVEVMVTTTSTALAPARPRWIVPAAVVTLLGVMIAGGLVALGLGAEERAPEQAAAAPREEPEEAPPVERGTETAPVEEPAVEPAVERVVAAPASITVESVPATVQVFDTEGALLGDTPLSLPRPSRGERIGIELRADGYATQPVVLSHLSTERVLVRLERRSPAPRRRPAVERPAERQPAPAAAEPNAPPMRRSELRDPWD